MNFFTRDWKKALTAFQSSDRPERTFIPFDIDLLIGYHTKYIVLQLECYQPWRCTKRLQCFR